MLGLEEEDCLEADLGQKRLKLLHAMDSQHLLWAGHLCWALG